MDGLGDDLVSGAWLEARLGTPGLTVIDASLFLPGAGRDGRAGYAAAHIPGAVFLDLEAVSDPDDPLPHMLPSAEAFGAAMRNLGVGRDDRVVVYDDSPLHSAARAWWMIRLFGHGQVALLDGGLGLWKAEGRPLVSGHPARPAGDFVASALDVGTVADKAFVGGIVHSDGHAIVDARPAERFAGLSPEPRPGVAPGHIPGAKSLPQSALFRPDGRWKRGPDLLTAFAEAGVALDVPMVTTCGSGVTAAVLLFGAHLLGKEDVRLYDGSWAEWGADPATPKATAGS